MGICEVCMLNLLKNWDGVKPVNDRCTEKMFFMRLISAHRLFWNILARIFENKFLIFVADLKNSDLIFLRLWLGFCFTSHKFLSLHF